ncbi:MAG: HEAT repeat domain-containing protein [Treponema sp.]|nr:HEAT repeat domain-containing protein [Treponema sp.]MCL2272059.1 HEAT repeat domain-containing protein [Treponema sp.]
MIAALNSILKIELPAWVYICALAALILLALFLIWFIHTRIFKYRLRKMNSTHNTDEHAEAIQTFQKHYPADRLTLYSKRMERYSRQMGPQIVRETGLADKWVQKLSSSSLPRTADLRRVLLYCPQSALFKAFLAAGNHPHLKKYFFEWMEDEGEEKVIRLLAESCRGEDFDPASGKTFLDNHSVLLRDLTGESEWYARYFAYKILLLDKEELAQRSLEAGLMDSHPLVRKILTENFNTDEREKVWNILWEKLVKDPVYEVRKTARRRIAGEYMDLYSLMEKDFDTDETFRVLELLDPDSLEDRSFAMAILESDDKELRFPAAAFLDKCGVLSSILAQNTFDEPNKIDQNINLLQKALEVNVSGFLKDYPSNDGGPLLVVARLFAESNGTHDGICLLAKKVFAFFSNKKPEPLTKEIYTKTLEAISINGNIKAYELLAEELEKKENDPLFLDLLLPRIPVKAELIFPPILFRFLRNSTFSPRDKLEQILGSFRPDCILPEAFRILNGSRAEFPHEVRISALKILVRLRLPFCIQRILESLPTLKSDETEDFARLLTEYPKDVFEEKAKTLLESPDAKIRASLISILPATKNTGFLKEIRSSLKDVDPDVRVAAIKALLGFGEIKLLNQETSMLHDPVERVRLATAEVIAKHGNTAALEILKNTINDPNETDSVKTGVIKGLGQAVSAEGIPILVTVLDSDSMIEFRKDAEEALSNRTSKRDITQLIEIFKDTEPQLREKLIPVFKGMGRQAEPWILEILKDEVASFKPYLVKILEETGYVEEAKRQLSNRDVEVRRDAAKLLSLLDTLTAFRGLVLAAKDPDQEVRICVVKALEKLKSDSSREILEKLKEDPDSRIRKYTFWAMERLDSLGLE